MICHDRGIDQPGIESIALTYPSPRRDGANCDDNRSLNEPGAVVDAPDFLLASGLMQDDELERLPVCGSRRQSRRFEYTL